VDRGEDAFVEGETQVKTPLCNCYGKDTEIWEMIQIGVQYQSVFPNRRVTPQEDGEYHIRGMDTSEDANFYAECIEQSDRPFKLEQNYCPQCGERLQDGVRESH
jgi:hypothetical protein